MQSHRPHLALNLSPPGRIRTGKAESVLGWVGSATGRKRRRQELEEEVVVVVVKKKGRKKKRKRSGKENAEATADTAIMPRMATAATKRWWRYAPCRP
jgi:hypothetical protein